MLVELFIFFEIIAIGLFIASFWTHNEILWALCLVITGVLMFTSYNIEGYVYTWNASISAYSPTLVYHSYPYLMGLNLLFFVLSLILGLFDLFEKYSQRYAKSE